MSRVLFTGFLSLLLLWVTSASERHVRKLIPVQSAPWNAPEWADTLLNENLTNPQWIAKGKQLYNTQCIVCHGENGRGDGESGFGLDVPPGDLNDAYTRQESDGALYWKITNGREPMPSFAVKFTETQRWYTVAYIREIQHKMLSKKK